MRLRTAVVASALLAAPLALAAADRVPAETRPLAMTLLHRGHLLNHANGRNPGSSAIVIEKDRGVAVKPGRSARSGAGVFDLGCSTCLPRLINAQAHLTTQFGPTTYRDRFRLTPAGYATRGTLFARRTLMAGFTSVRILGDIASESIALRNAINCGVIAGPHIYTSDHADPDDGYRIDWLGDSSPLHGNIDTPDNRGKALRARYKLGVAVTKIMPSGGALGESASGNKPPQVAAQLAAISPEILANAGKAYRDGARIAFGTVAGAHPHGDGTQEFTYRVEAGMPALASIQTATFIAVALLRLPDEFGRITPGYRVDVITVASDPLAGVSLLQQIGAVVKDGLVFKRDGHAAGE